MSTWAAAMGVVVLGGVFTGACGGGGADTTAGGTTGSSPKPAGGTLNPPAVNDGTGMPINTTGETCQSAYDCSLWSCDCTDDYIIYAAFCLNGYCLDASGACPDACTTPLWNHGSWTGTTGGEGPVITSGVGATSGNGGVGGGNSSGGVGGGDPGPTCTESGEPCTESSDCCSYFCNLDTCN